MDEKVVINLEGFDATMKIYEDRAVIIGKKNLYGFMYGKMRNGSKQFYFQDLTSVQYKKASIWTNGFIQFEYPGSHSGNNHFSENSFGIMYGKTDLKLCEKAYEYIKERIDFYKRNKNSGGFSQADEILKFKELLDAGIITQEEFEEKKKKILDL